MRTLQAYRGWFVSCAPAAFLALGLGIALHQRSTAQETAGQPAADVYRVEEDWELVVASPDPNDDGPQVTCTISPGDIATAYCALDLNYHTQPEYSAGGLQLHTWDPEDLMKISNSSRSGVMQTDGETVTWTQSMTLDVNRIVFQIVNGQSQTWGTFGGDDDSLRLTMKTSRANLNTYNRQLSLDNSGVSFAGTRVTSLKLKATRWYDVNGQLIQQDTEPQTVHPLD